jgi:hypothetical protein
MKRLARNRKMLRVSPDGWIGSGEQLSVKRGPSIQYIRTLDFHAMMIISSRYTRCVCES